MMTVDIDSVDYDGDGRALVDDAYFTGEVTETDAAGRTVFRGSYRDGWQDGPEQRFFPDGTPEFEGSWTRGRQTGRHRFWHPNGQPAEEIDYDERGNATRVGRWNPDGTAA